MTKEYLGRVPLGEWWYLPKMVWLLLLLIFGTHFSCDLSASELAIVSFGDSTTAPRGQLMVYTDLLRNELLRGNQQSVVFNAGVGGNTTEMGRKRFERDVIGKQPSMVIIQFGINDSAVDVWKTPSATKPRVSLDRYGVNLRYFIRELKKQQAQVVLMTPNSLRWTPKLKELYGKYPYLTDQPDGFNVLLKQYAELVRKIGKEQSVPVVDVYAAFEKYGKKTGQSVEHLLLDGIS